MPKHIISGLKYLATIELKKRGYTQQKIAKTLEIDRSTVSHYLNGRNLSWRSIEVAQTITELIPKDFLILVDTLLNDNEATRTLVNICKTKQFNTKIKESCIGCGLCVDLCIMKAINLDDLQAQIDSNWCCGCQICAERCPTKSIIILEVKDDREY